jgi:murein DD-endopeptidase MepM/ murein hydrolase activator NlpD
MIAEESFPTRGAKQKVVRLVMDTEALKLKNGPAIVNIRAIDRSLFKNETLLAIQVKIDTTVPQISVLNPVNYINQGGTGFITYRTSKPTALTGVYVDDKFFPGHTVLINGRPTSLTYFALAMDAANAKTKIFIFARDDAGNEARSSIPYSIKPKKFRSDKVNLSDAFLQNIMPGFQSSTPQLQGKSATDVFAYVNTTMREENTKTIQALCSKSINKQLWEGTFLRMRNAKPMALFGDQRTYLIAGKSYGTSVHLGVDLASTAHAPVEAANNGIVVFAGPLGIYGNAIIIDHGLGLFSLYGHLSSIETAVGKTVKKEEKIAVSGMTGLAGGDHLHFSILAGGQFVNPQEWWDPHWIADNVMKKMAM